MALTPVLLLVGAGGLLILTALLSPVVVTVWRRRRISSRGRWGWVALALAVIISSGCGIGSNVPPTPNYLMENRSQDVLGQVEPVVLAERDPIRARLSPDGRWVLVLSETNGQYGPLVAIDLEHNQEHVMLSDGSPMTWINSTHAMLDRGIMLRVPDLKMWNLTDREPIPDSLDKLEGAPYIYALDYGGRHAELVSSDPAFPYRVTVKWNTAEVEAHLASIPHTIIEAGGLQFDPNTQRYFSPDGRYYITNRPFGDPDGGGGLQEAMFNAVTNQEVAHAYKYYWSTYFLGWAYDSSGAYFMFQPRSGDADVLHPRHPVYKLLVPGAAKRDTPVPVSQSTPTPTR